MSNNDTINTITVAVFAGNTHVLLLQRNPDEYPGHGDKYELIGGHIQVGESAAIAMSREIAEETGIIGLELQFVDRVEFSSHGEMADNWICYAVAPEELPITLSNEHMAYRWPLLSEALSMPLANKHSAILKNIVERFFA